MKCWIVAIGILVSAGLQAQCKTFKIGSKGDTLNCIDMQNRKQGKWVLHVNALRGEPGYEEEGLFRNDLREGTWRRYTLMGDLLAMENYRFGYKDGISRYFTMAGLDHEESWKASNPDHPYDTVEVPDPINPFKVEMKVIKVEGHTVKHGLWQYYDPNTGLIIRTEKYVLNELEKPGKPLLAGGPDSTGKATDTAAAKAKPREVQAFEKKNSGKKKVRVRNGATGY